MIVQRDTQLGYCCVQPAAPVTRHGHGRPVPPPPPQPPNADDTVYEVTDQVSHHRTLPLP